VAHYPGFLPFVLSHLLCEPAPPEPQLQVFFDLLAEMIKFNPPLLLEVGRHAHTPVPPRSTHPHAPAQPAHTPHTPRTHPAHTLSPRLTP
jgi:hypothetical protein